MKKYIYLLVLLSHCWINSKAQILSDENFIYTAVPQKPVQASNYGGLIPSEIKQDVTYFDGLGRPLQSIAIGQGGNASDIVTHIEYDGFGRQVKDYLPYAIPNQGNTYLKTGALSETNAFYNTTKYENTTNPFSQKEFEASPLNRVLQQAAQGNDWALANNHTIKLDYQTNVTGEVKLYTVSLSFTDNTYTPALSLSTANGGFYLANELYKTITKDENWTSGKKNNTTEEFKDKQGHVVLKRTYSDYTNTQGVIITAEVAHDTYYVYDDFGNLTYVLPPLASGQTIATSSSENNATSTAVVTLENDLHLTASNSIVLLPGFHAQTGSTFTATIIENNHVLEDLCYQYKYDYRNRLIEKKLPGKGWEYIVYDKLDRPILTQDANLRVSNKWLFTKYDALSRPVYTGEYINTAAGQITRADVQILANASSTLFETRQGANTINGTTVYYSNNAFPNINNTNINLFTINYYDDYSFDLNGGDSTISYGITPITNAKGLATGNKVRIIGTTNWITNVSYYDAKGRPIYSYSKNDYLATTSTVKSQLDFPGKTLETTSSHTRGSLTTNIVDTFAYDSNGRLLTQKQTINSQAQEVIVSNAYDNLGQLISKGVGGNTSQNRLQTIDYSYNIRGWLKGINDINAIGTDLFTFKINYNDIADVSKKLYNGNISQTFWKTASSDTGLKNYTYTYDALNRLTLAESHDSGRYNESLSYDKNGNIVGLLRLGNTIPNTQNFGTIDNLAYTYDSGNKLAKVEDSSVSAEGFNNGTSGSLTDYTYDDNGNMKTDANKNITAITYNYLNLPEKITFNTGVIDYFYDATGVKQRKTVNNGTTTDYAGGFIYEGNVLKFFSQPEGYVAYNSGTFDYIYQYKDHLGNIRLSYDKNLNIVEENNYYPFGLMQKGYNSNVNGGGNAIAQKYKYNGKELQDELGLGVYDYGARNYDPALGRWMNIDPLAELSRRFSPYTYALNNPVFFTDPDGMEAKGADGLTNDEWLSNNRRNIDSQMGGNGIDIKSMTYSTDEQRVQNEKENGKSTATAGDAEMIDDSIGPPTKEEQEQEYWRKYNEERLLPLNKKLIEFAFIADGAAGLSELFAYKLPSLASVKGWFSFGAKNIIPEGKLGNHLFSSVSGRVKLLDTAANRALITKISNGRSLGVDAYGKSWYAKNLSNGQQIYSYSQNGIIKGAGVNSQYVDLVARYGLK
jgi:RHS repeat-associated protein